MNINKTLKRALFRKKANRKFILLARSFPLEKLVHPHVPPPPPPSPRI